MRIGRTIPPAAAPVSITDLLNGISGIVNPDKCLKQFQESIIEHFGAKYCFLLSSGKAAISVSLLTLSEIYPRRKQVIIPALNCFSVPSAVVNAGFTVCPCDIDPGTLQLDENSLVKIVNGSDDILAVIPAHLFGLPAPVSRIARIAAKAGIAVIEDAAQAMGSSVNRKFLGTQADVGIFSLSKGKAFSTGEGGIILTSRDDIGRILNKKVSFFPQHTPLYLIRLILQNLFLSVFIDPGFFWLPKALPFLKLGETVFNTKFQICHLSGFQAALAANWKTRLPVFLRQRFQRNQYYSENLRGINGIIPPACHFSESFPCIRYPLIVLDVNQVKHIIKISEKEGLGISVTYPDTIDQIQWPGIHSGRYCHNAQSILRNLVTLPCHPLITYREIDKIVKVIRSVVDS